MSISPRSMDKLRRPETSYQERYYYMQRCLYNVALMREKGDKTEACRMQWQADQIAIIIYGDDVRAHEAPEWLAKWAPDECKKFWKPIEPKVKSEGAELKLG